MATLSPYEPRRDMRILKVWDYEYPWDVRTEKVCRALTSMGHDVHLLARNRRRESLTESLPEATVHRLRPWSFFGGRLDAASQFPAFVNPRWLFHAHRVGRRQNIDLILVRDITLAPVAITVARRLGVPVLLDMAEHYAAMMQDLWDTGSVRFGDSIVRNPKAVAAVERWTLAHVDHTLVVVEESKERLVRSGVDPEEVTVVSNTPSLSRVEEYAAIAAAEGASTGDRSARDPMRLVYLGVMEEARGVGLVIEALAEVRARGVPATLDLIGEGRSLGSFTERARALGMTEDVVRTHGFVEYSKALRIVARMDAGLIPHHASEGWQHTIPNKLFDYMSLALPVIASDVRPVRRVLTGTGAGVTFRDRDSSDLARVIQSIYMDPDRLAMGARGISAIRERYNWDRDAAVLKGVVDHLAQGSRPHA